MELLTHIHSILCLSAPGVGRSNLFNTFLILVKGLNGVRSFMEWRTRAKSDLGRAVSVSQLACCSLSLVLSGEYEKPIKLRKDKFAV